MHAWFVTMLYDHIHQHKHKSRQDGTHSRGAGACMVESQTRPDDGSSFIVDMTQAARADSNSDIWPRLVGQTLEWPNLHSVRFPTVAFCFYLVIIVQSLTN